MIIYNCNYLSSQIGIYDLNKTSNFPAIVTPFCSKSIYQITWAQISQGPDKPDTERYVLLTCTDGELRYIPDSGDNKYCKHYIDYIYDHHLTHSTLFI